MRLFGRFKVIWDLLFQFADQYFDDSAGRYRDWSRQEEDNLVWEGVQTLDCRGVPKDQGLGVISRTFGCHTWQINHAQVFRIKDLVADQVEFARWKSVTEKWEWPR